MKLNHPVVIFGFHLLFIILLLTIGWNAAIGDWGNYYYGAAGYVDGHAQGIYDVARFNNYVDSYHLKEDYFLSYTQVPPLSLLIYFPFTLMKVGLAKLVFTITTYLLCAFSITRLFTKMQIDLRWSMLLPLLLLLPFRSNVDAGQSYFLLLALLAEGWLARENGKWILAAFLFAFAIHLKIFPAIVLIWLLAGKDWKMFGATICAVAILFGVSLLYVDWGTWEYYCVEVLPRLAKGEITNTYATAYQSMPVLLKQLFVPDAMHNPSAAFDSGFLYRFGTIIWSGMVLMIAFLFSFDKKQSSFLRFAVWIFAGMLISGYGSTYGLLLLIFPAIAIVKQESLNRNTKFALLFLIALIANIPMNWIMNFSLPFSFLRLFLMLCFFAGLIYLFRPQWNRLALIAMLVPFLSLINGKSQLDGSDYFLKKEPSLLITDYRIESDTIIYSYRDGEGLHEGRELFAEQIEQVEEKGGYPHFAYWDNVEYRFYGEQISELVVINNKYFLYLSDKNRGAGFYTLRIKQIKYDKGDERILEE
ncbi:MAG: DUF2029 domain-containing protein [Bacteroidota bacterium]|nr:DUF2029 domain-containing protein [Bacteroidota bacterium]